MAISEFGRDTLITYSNISFKEHFEILQRSGLKDCCFDMFNAKVGSKYCGAIETKASHKIEM